MYIICINKDVLRCLREKIRDQIIPYSFQERLKTHFDNIHLNNIHIIMVMVTIGPNLQNMS